MLENEPTDTNSSTKPESAEPAATEAAAKPARRRRAAARPAGPPVENVPVAEADPAAVNSAEASPEPDGAAPASGTRRTRRKAPAAKAADEGGEPAAAADQSESRPPPASVTAPLFQPPVLEQADAAAEPAAPRRRSRRAGAPAAEAPVEPTETEPTDEAAEGSSEEELEESEDGTTRRRRRRRGGRGRRGRTSQGDEEPGEDGHETPTAEAAEEVEPDADAAGQADGTGSRRRRRRRRRGEEGGGEADDPENTVTRVRGARGDGEVASVRGSTRLEAKKQRRREGREAGRRRVPILSEAEFLARREAVARVMVVRQNADRTQIAVLEDGVLVEHYVNAAGNSSLIGDIFLGRVQNVLPSMEAAFVDIGKGRNAVLYAGEVNFEGLEGQPKRIEHVLKSGQSVLVQVTKDSVGHKGARLTSQISLPGRYLVYVPESSMTGISRKLPDTERNRLKAILRQVVPDDAGVIVRTAAEGASEDELRRDVERLTAQWEQVQVKARTASAPALLLGEPDLTIRVVRDVFNEDFEALVVSGEEAWSEVSEYVGRVAPDLTSRLTKWADRADVFAAHRVDEQILKALDRKVWLPSGGSLVIDRTEAMTVIDVNTGKFTGSGGNLEETVTRNNLEAAEELVRQLRLRDIGGIIVIDFIDMVLESNRELVLRRLVECLGRDRTKHQVAEVTSLGLVQMTRKRIGQGLLEAFSTVCDHCNGRGILVRTDEPSRAKAPKPAPPPGGRNGKAAPEPAPAVEPALPAAAADGEVPTRPSRRRRRGRGGDAAAPEAVGGAEAAPDVVVVHPRESAEAEPDEAAPPRPARRSRRRAADAATAEASV